MVFQSRSGFLSSRWLPYITLVLLSACSQAGDEPGKRGPGGPVKVGYIVIAPADVPVTAELAGRITASRSAQVRPQISGVIRKRLFVEGALVRAGQPLYQIDAELYRAAHAEALASLNSAQASATASRERAQRLAPLAKMEAVSAQDYTDALAQARQAQAAVEQARARLDTARVTLRYTTVPAPITGRIGRSLFTEGALVSASQADPLALINRLDPVYVDIQQSSAEMLSLRRALQTGNHAPSSTTVRILLEDGSEYALSGQLEFAETSVNPVTGTVTLRARVPNPHGLLLPGMFVRARFAQGTDRNAFLVPQSAVVRNARGAAYVYLVGKDGKAIKRDVTADRTIGRNWVITAGLNRGDQLIVQGIGALKPDSRIDPVPASSAQKIGPMTAPAPSIGRPGA